MEIDITYKDFKEMYSFQQRKEESTRILEKYPDRLPIVCQRSNDKMVPLLKKKYLIPRDLTIGQFVYVIRQRIKLDSQSAIFVFIGKKRKVPPTGILISELYKEYADEDGFIYIYYSGENTFGCHIETTY
jgi:GABA(A) receptor-associated protein